MKVRKSSEDNLKETLKLVSEMKIDIWITKNQTYKIGVIDR